jgi:hypothetical protein
MIRGYISKTSRYKIKLTSWQHIMGGSYTFLVRIQETPNNTIIEKNEPEIAES